MSIGCILQLDSLNYLLDQMSIPWSGPLTSGRCIIRAGGCIS
jgi:hypothetical protein